MEVENNVEAVIDPPLPQATNQLHMYEMPKNKHILIINGMHPNHDIDV